MRNGLYHENGELIYYKDGVPKHAGVIKVDGAIYYISSRGRAVKGCHVVHHEMTNGILKRGTYTFGEDYKLVSGSYIAPRKRQKSRTKTTNKRRPIPRDSIGKRLTATMKNQRTWVILGELLLIVFLVGIATTINSNTTPGDETTNVPKVSVILPNFEEDVLLCSAAANLEYNGQMSLADAVETGDPYRPFYFKYTLLNTSGVLYLSENEDLSDAHEYPLTMDATFVEIDNLKTNTTYFYKAEVDGEDYLGSFHTAPGNRFVKIPGLKNTRDIGGYITQDGKTVKQGLLIRGVELDGLVNAPYYIPEEDLTSVQNTFGFVYDFDLRGASIYNSVYTSRLDVPHTFYNAPMYGEIFTDGYRDALRNIFRDLADPGKYPMYLHCTWGMDRTGTIIFLLQGILNMTEEDMVREYRLTSYTSKSLAESTNMDVIINGLKPYDGDTLQEKIVTFLTTDIGVTEEEIDSIRGIFGVK